MQDLVIRAGGVFDGTGADPVIADVTVKLIRASQPAPLL